MGSSPSRSVTRKGPLSVEKEVALALDWLKHRGSKAGRDGMTRYALPSTRAFGVAMRDVQALAKRLGRNQDLAAALCDKTPHAWAMVNRWAGGRDEFVKRAAFAMLWGLSVHDKAADERAFLTALAFIERAADDDRHFVKKAVNMALRAVGKRSAALHAASVNVATSIATVSALLRSR